MRAFKEQFDFVHRCVRRYGARPAEMDDLIQEVFIAMWRRWSDFDETRPLRPWLAGIAFRVVRCHIRRRGPDPVPVDAEAAQTASAGKAAQLPDASDDARELVLAAVARLPERHRVALVMHDLDEVSPNEMARLLEVPLSTVYTRVRRARLAFAKVVEELRERQPAKAHAALLTPESLLAMERIPPAAPELARARAESFAEAVVRMPAAPPDPLAREAPSPGPGSGARWGASGRPSLWLAWGALAGATAVALVLLGSRPAPAPPPALAGPGAAVNRGSLAGKLTPPRRANPKSIPTFTVPQTSGPATYSADVARDLGVGLTGYWPLDDGPGARVARDLSGSGRHCRFRNLRPNAGWIAGVHGRALALEAKTWLHCPQPPVMRESPGDLTVAAWVKRLSPRAPAAVITRQIGKGFEDHFFLGFNFDSLRVASHVWGGLPSVAAPPPSQRWHHLAFSHDRDGTTRLYLDGVEVAHSTGELRRGAGEINSPITIGAGRYSRFAWSVRQQLDGAVDEVLVYDRVLSSLEVRALSAGVRPLLTPAGDISSK